MPSRRAVLLAQLPIPPAGLQPIKGNVPLAAGYLKLFARRCGMADEYSIDILPTSLVNNLSDRGLVDEIVDRAPWMIGFSCYLWNVERTLWVVERVKKRLPNLLVVLGGPEVTADNGWVLEQAAVDYAAVGEGEQTFVELLRALAAPRPNLTGIAGLHVHPRHRPVAGGLAILAAADRPTFRKPLDDLDKISSPYIDGDLDAADESMLFLETVRGCIYKCKFCYYPKSYDDLHYLSNDRIRASLDHARAKGVAEVVLLDPTLNQRKDFGDFLRLLAAGNSDRTFTYFGELRGEGIGPEQAELLRAANFTEVEIGLQSIDPQAQSMMDRKNNLKYFERGAKAMLDAGLKVKVDLIIGLPGDTEASVRRGIHYLRDAGLHSDIQVFNLAILPGTAFREEATALGLRHQPRPPYYVLQTPTLTLSAMYDLMDEAMTEFDTEFDPPPEPIVDRAQLEDLILPDGRTLRRLIDIDLDALDFPQLPGPGEIAQSICIWFKAVELNRRLEKANRVLTGLLEACPFSTLQIVIEPVESPTRIRASAIEAMLQNCLAQPTYLDRLYGLQSGRPNGAKRAVIVVDCDPREDWLEEIEEVATVVVRRRQAIALNALSVDP